MTASPDRSRLPRLHVVTDDLVLRDPAFPTIAAALLEAGGARIALHVRGPGLDGRRLWNCAAPCAEIARRTGGWLFVNDRIDVAMACRAAGIQLGRSSVPIPAARALVGETMAVGASIHDASEGEEAAREGADFVFAGTLYETPSHPGQAGSGASLVADLERLPLPVVGIGGIDIDRVDEVIGAGAHGVAVIRGVWGAADPVGALREYLRKLE